MKKNLQLSRCLYFSAVLTLISFFGTTAFAAINDSNETAGAEQARFEKERNLEAQAKAAKLSTPQPVSEVTPTPGAPSGVTFQLKSVKITGNESITTAELEPLYSQYAGKQVSLDDLKNIATGVKQYYRDRGFIAAYVYLPPQNVTAGDVEIAVIEGKIGQVEIKGNRWFSTSLLRRMLHITSDNILFYDELRKGLNFLNKNRDIKTSAVLKPGKESKTTDVEINVKDKFPLHLSTDVNNLGTDNTGKVRWGVGVTDTNLLGLMDELSARFQIGSNAYAVGANYTIPVTSYQTALNFSYSYSSVNLGGDFKALDVEGTASTYGVSVVQPFYDKVYSNGIGLNAGATVGFDFKTVRNRVLGQKAGTDDLRILNLGLNLEESDKWGRTILPQSVHFGFSNFLGASDNVDAGATRAGSGGQFFAYRSSFLRYQRLPKELVFAMRGNFQLTPDRLAPSEQFRLGGAFSVRGYQEGEYLADSGALMQNEIYVPTYFFPKDWKLPYSSQPLYKQIRGVGFIDYGGGIVRAHRNGEDGSKFLAGIGGGVRIELLDHVYGRFQWGAPIGNKPSDGTKGTFYFGVSADVF